MKLSSFSVVCFFLVCLSALADDFPKTISLSLGGNSLETTSEEVKHHSFQLSGTTERSVLFFSIYEIALYQNEPSVELEEPYVLWLRYSRDLSKSSIESALREGLEANSKKENLRDILHVFDVALLPKLRNVAEGESLRLVRLSPSKAVVKINEESTSILEGELFLEALFSIWLGGDSVVSRDDLFSNS